MRKSLMILAGILMALPFTAFCPEIFKAIFPFLSLILFLHELRPLSPKASFWRAWLFGSVFFLVGVSWVYVSIHEFGNVSWLLSGFITLCFAVFLGLFYGLMGYTLNRLALKIKSPSSLFYEMLLFPTMGMLFEWLKSFLFTGFPWLEIGVTSLYSPLQGFVPLLGIYGATGLIYFVAGSLHALIFSAPRPKKILIIISLASLFLLGKALTFVSFTHPLPQKITVSLVQGNIAQSLKWNENELLASLKTYAELSEPLSKSDLILWPETAIPFDQETGAPYLKALSTWLEIHPSIALVTGIPWSEPPQIFNAALGMGKAQGVYRKQHLVPFGEYLPLHPLSDWFFDWINIPMSDFSKGAANQPLIAFGYIKLATLICYESAFNTLTKKAASQGNAILVLSDDAWFGDSFGPYQHLQTNQIRALENQKPLLNVTNNGITAILSSSGKILGKLPQFQARVLTQEISLYEGKTPFDAWGNFPVLIWILSIILWIFRAQTKSFEPN